MECRENITLVDYVRTSEKRKGYYYVRCLFVFNQAGFYNACYLWTDDPHADNLITVPQLVNLRPLAQVRTLCSSPHYVA